MLYGIVPGRFSQVCDTALNRCGVWWSTSGFRKASLQAPQRLLRPAF